MSTHKSQIRPTYLNQSSGLIRVAREQTTATKDFGFYGTYSTNKYGGFTRSAADSKFYLFDGLTTAPTDTVTTTDATFNKAAMVVGSLLASSATGTLTMTPTSISSVGGSTLTVSADAAITITAASALTLTATSGDVLLVRGASTLTANSVLTYSVLATVVSAATQGKLSVALASAGNLLSTKAGTGASHTLTMNGVGASSIDSVSLTLGMRILILGQTAAADNGIYTVSTLGTATVSTVFTRSADASTGTQLNTSAYVYVDQGAVYAGAGFIMSTTGTITLDGASASAINWSSITTGPLAATTATSTSLFSLVKTGTSTTFNLDVSKLTGAGALISGSIAPGFGSITTANTITGSSLVATSGGITITAGGLTVSSGTIATAGIITSNGVINAVGGITLSGTLTGATGSSITAPTILSPAITATSLVAGAVATSAITVPLSSATALAIADTNGLAYLTVNTVSTNGTQGVIINQSLTAASATIFNSTAQFAAGTLAYAVAVKSASFSASVYEANVYTVSASVASVIVTLPALSSSVGVVFTVLKSDSSTNSVTIKGYGTQLLDGAASGSVVLSLFNEHVQLLNTGVATGWISL